EGRAVTDLDRLDLELAGKPFLLGRAATVADVSCCGYLYWLDQAGLDVGRWPRVAAWLDRIRALPGWRHPYELLA
ncbi:MAG TPA: glutathione S-transferase C-terminal domain-containing protein, partial [Thalassobaculum sp.]